MQCLCVFLLPVGCLLANTNWSIFGSKWFDAFRIQQTAVLHIQPWIGLIDSYRRSGRIMVWFWWTLACYVRFVCCLKPVIQCHSRLQEFLLLGDVLTNSFLLSKTSLHVSAVIISLILFLKSCILLLKLWLEIVSEFTDTVGLYIFLITTVSLEEVMFYCLYLVATEPCCWIYNPAAKLFILFFLAELWASSLNWICWGHGKI